MPNAFKGQINIGFSVSEAGGSPVFNQAQQWQANLDFVQSFVNGVVAGAADLEYLAERSIAASSNDDVDLAGVLLTGLGQTITMAKLKALFILNRPRDPAAAANVSDLTIGGAANPFIAAFGGVAASRIGPIKPGGFLLLGASDLAGIGAVTAATADLLRIANGAGGTANYVLGLIGTSS